ncbi:hypothetical protein OROGR_012322 [Orobanche gracilis]
MSRIPVGDHLYIKLPMVDACSFVISIMDASGNNESKVDIQSLVKKISFEKALKDAKASLEKAEKLAILLSNAIESLGNLNVEDGVLRSAIRSVRHASIEVEEKSVDDEALEKVRDCMLQILLPKYFEKK